MSVPKTVAEVLREHVLLEVEGIDRLYLNVYQPRLQRELGAIAFFRFHRKKAFASTQLMAEMTRAFVAAIDRFAAEHAIPVVHFAKGVRKDDIAQQRLAQFPHAEGVVFIGKAQEKATVFRTVKRRNPRTGQSYPWLTRSTAMVNYYYFYCLDKDFGPFFLKFCSYFPYTARLCLNGHEYVKRQLAQTGIAFEALDNGILSCADPQRLQALCDGLSAAKIDRLLRKWLKRLPHPFTAHDRQAGYRYDVSILQAEFALTQVLDRPVAGRMFFEQVIRENLHLGRPDQVTLIFQRRLLPSTKSRFRTRVITQGVTPSVHVDYKNTRIKQYHKENRALRTETTINDTQDFGLGRRLCNLPALRAVGFQANRRLLHVQQLSHDPLRGAETLQDLARPQEVAGQRVSGLRFGDPTVLAVFLALLIFRLQPRGFTQRELRATVAALLGQPATAFTAGQMTYQLRRLRLRGFLRRLPKTHRYEVTDAGLQTALLFARGTSWLMRPLPPPLQSPAALDSPPLIRILAYLRKTLVSTGEFPQAA